MEDQNQNLDQEEEIETKPQEVAAPEAKPADTQDYMFYNVMPKVQNGGVVEPSLKMETQDKVQAGTAEPSKIKTFVLSHKLYFILGLVIIIAAPVGYYFISKLGQAPQEDLLIPAPANHATTKPATSTPTSAAGFTTPQDWREKYFAKCQDPAICGDSADADHDGLNNGEEYKLTTDPNNADSDQDGLADGDEVHVFGSSPLNAHTSSNAKYSDSDYVKGTFSFSTNQKMPADQIAQVTAKMKSFGLHPPTFQTLVDTLNSLYGFSSPVTTTPAPAASSTAPSAATSTPPSGVDQSLSAKQDRDTKRSDTIKNIEAGLVKYQTDNKAYPQTNNFSEMFSSVKPYLKVATNPLDPINKDPYLYSYTPNAVGTDFTLSFYSEVAGQVIKKTAADAQKDSKTQDAAIYDNQRQTDLESLRVSLLLYSNNNVAGNQTYVFPSVAKFKTALVPDYITQIPKDPKTGSDYSYQVSPTFNTFTLKTLLDDPASGTAGYMCNQDECSNY